MMKMTLKLVLTILLGLKKTSDPALETCTSPATGHHETICTAASTSQAGSFLLDFAFPFLEQLAGGFDRRQTRNCYAVAPKGVQAVLEN
jgi:hypothetical protein